jgi:hypothetical protein
MGGEDGPLTLGGEFRSRLARLGRDEPGGVAAALLLEAQARDGGLLGLLRERQARGDRRAQENDDDDCHAAVRSTSS